MGVHRDGGYSASVSGFLVVGPRKFRLAKTNNRTFFLAEPCELPAGTVGELLITIDGVSDRQSIELPEGIVAGQTAVKYSVVATF